MHKLQTKHKTQILQSTNFLSFWALGLCVLFVFCVFGLWVFEANAQTTPPEDTSRFLPLVTCGKNIDGKPETTLPGEQSCKICDIWVLSDRVVNFAFFLATPILIIVLIAGGFIYLTSGGNPKKTEQAKSLLTSAIVGIIIALAAWLIVSTILKNLAKEGNDIILPWDKMPTCPDPLAPEKVDLSKLPKPTVLGTPGTYADEQKARDALEGFSGTGERVPINKRPCTSIEDSNCTNVAGLPKSAIDYLRQLQDYCSDPKTINCKFVLSGGTEYWLHSENTRHKPGNSVVDVVPNKQTQAIYKALIDAAGAVATIRRCEDSSGNQVLTCSVPQTNHIHFEFRR